jgi:hypothetical protein
MPVILFNSGNLVAEGAGWAPICCFTGVGRLISCLDHAQADLDIRQDAKTLELLERLRSCQFQ